MFSQFFQFCISVPYARLVRCIYILLLCFLYWCHATKRLFSFKEVNAESGFISKFLYYNLQCFIFIVLKAFTNKVNKAEDCR